MTVKKSKKSVLKPTKAQVKEAKKQIITRPKPDGQKQKPRAVSPKGKPLQRREEYLKGKVGAPAWVPTEGTLKEVERLAALGFHQKHIAPGIGISIETWCVKKKEYPQLAEAFERGKNKNLEGNLGCLERAQKSNNYGAAIFMMRSSHGYQEEPKEDLQNDGRDKEAVAERIREALRRIKSNG